MTGNLDCFTAVWCLDFEFVTKEGDNPDPVCLVAHELRCGTLLRLWRDELTRQCPLESSPETLHVAFYASAEWNYYLALGWTLPTAVIDLYAEFRMMTNNRVIPLGKGLLGALACYGLSGIISEHKTGMRRLRTCLRSFKGRLILKGVPSERGRYEEAVSERHQP